MSRNNKKYQDILQYELSTLDDDTRLMLSNELHHSYRSKFKHRNVIAHEIDEVWSCDLMDMINLSSFNDGYKYSLNVVDVFSKFAWSIPIKDKYGRSIVSAFQDLFSKTNRKPKFLWVDKGGEFYNTGLTNYLKEFNISMYSTFSESKSVVVERFNRTIKDFIFRYFTSHNTKKWINIIPKFLDMYNNRIHSTIKMTPTEASNKENEDEVYQTFVDKDIKERLLQPPNYDVGDIVRISRLKNIFEKGYDHNWSLNVYNIHRVLPTAPVTYILSDGTGEIIKGSFYDNEILDAQAFKKAFIPERVVQEKIIDKIPYSMVRYKGKSEIYDRFVPTVSLKSFKFV